MKMVTLLSTIILFCISGSLAQTSQSAMQNNRYFVQSPHTKEQCMNVMDEMKGKGDQYLSKFNFGCMAGDHTAYAILEAPSEDAARKMLPKDLQQSAKIVKVDRFSVAQIEKMHKDMH